MRVEPDQTSLRRFEKEKENGHGHQWCQIHPTDPHRNSLDGAKQRLGRGFDIIP